MLNLLINIYYYFPQLKNFADSNQHLSKTDEIRCVLKIEKNVYWLKNQLDDFISGFIKDNN